MIRALAVVTGLFVAATACGAEDELTVFAAASLTEVFATIAPDARFNFAGSSELAIQIREGAPADVFASAHPSYSQTLFEEGLIGRPRTFATNRLVLIVPRSNPGRIRSVSDLDREGIRLIIGAPGVPVGDYARAALEDVGELDALDRVVSEEQDVKDVAGKVAIGEADAGFVYATDVDPVAGKVRVIELPAGAQPEIRYTLSVVKSSERREAAAEFVRLVLGERGRVALSAAGFGLP